jgi:hypothetical protein
MSYLRNGWSVNLRAIEKCIFSIRSIERNMRSILRTVYPSKTYRLVNISSFTVNISLILSYRNETYRWIKHIANVKLSALKCIGIKHITDLQ